MGELIPFDGQRIQLSLNQRATHTYVIGQPGMGKSRALESWIMQDIASGRGVAVIDPHGDLYHNLVLGISRLLPTHPELEQRIVLVDPRDPVWTIGFNPLQPIHGISQERMAWLLTDVIIKIWKLDATTAPRMLRLLTYTFLALSEFGLSLIDLPRLLRDDEWRESLLSRTQHPDMVDYFRFEFPKGEGAVHQWVTPVLNKIGPLVFDPDVRLILAAGSTINFRTILDKNLVLLANLPKGILGEGNSSLLAAFIVAHFQQAALSRADTWQRSPFFLYLDEFQNYTTDNIKDILSESRKYGLSLVLAHQYLDQLSTDVRGAVLNTAGTIVSFRVGYHDASELSREIFLPGSLITIRRDFNLAHLERDPWSLLQEKVEPLDHEAAATLLTKLKPREFWMKRRGPYPPIKQRALEVSDPIMTKELVQQRRQLADASGRKFGKIKSEVKRQFDERRKNDNSKSSTGGRPTTYYEKA